MDSTESLTGQIDTFNLRLPRALRRDLDWAARREGNFLAPWVRRILSEAIAHEKRREKRERTHGR